MRTRMLRRFAFTAAFASLVCAAAYAQDASPGGKPLHADLDGAAEVPITGDPDATGRAVIRVNSGQGTVCYDITVVNAAPILAAHIHLGAVGVPGGILVHLDPIAGVLSGCETGVDRDLIKEIRKNPEAYYVNVHNAPFQAGAARGQLEPGH
jgi:hypothetical protein